jgi:hypothetical protein
MTDAFNQRPEKLVDNNLLVLGIAAALRTLGTHARDRAAAGGLANLRATLWPVGENKPVALVSNVGMRNEPVGPAILRERPAVDAVADLDDLALDGPGQVAATYRLASGLYQEFGKPEAPLVTAVGGLRVRYWHPTAQKALTDWAAAGGVDVSMQLLQ